MESLCGIHGHLKTRDPKDSVHGFLGLLGGLDITVDYNKSVEEIYKDMTSAFCGTTNSLRLIVCKFSRNFQGSALPSWVVDWGDFSDTAADVTYFFHLYDARGSQVSYLDFRGDQMEVQGFPMLFLDKTNTSFGPDLTSVSPGHPNLVISLKFMAEFLGERGSTVMTHLGYKEELLLALCLGSNFRHAKGDYERIHHYTQLNERDAASYHALNKCFAHFFRRRSRSSRRCIVAIPRRAEQYSGWSWVWIQANIHYHGALVHASD